MRDDKLAQLRAGLENLRARYDAHYLPPDPLQFPRRFSRAEDQEVVGLVASSLAYGNVTTIRKSVERVVLWMGPHPYRFARAIEPTRELDRLAGFRPPWRSAPDAVCV